MPQVPSPLHRALGVAAGPLTSDLIDQAVDTGVGETADLDWKSTLIPQKSLKESDFSKDVAAMANAGGGMIVYGVAESGGKATARTDVGEVHEAYLRTMRQVAAGIQPPVFGLDFHPLGDEPERALAVVIPASHEAPHLVYYKDLFGAPIRNGSDTTWMREREIENAYRLRHERRRRTEQELLEVYIQASSVARTAERAWITGVARPTSDRPLAKLSREHARIALKQAQVYALQHAPNTVVHPLDGDVLNPRVGLRRWTAPMNGGGTPGSAFREAWASIHWDGTVSLAAAMGAGRQTQDSHFGPGEIAADRIEAFIADLFGLVRAASESAPMEFEIRIDVEPADGHATWFVPRDNSWGYDRERAIEIRRFIPVVATVTTDASIGILHDQVRDLALDVLNQGGVQQLIVTPDSIA